MKNAKECQCMDDIRFAIDQIDAEIVRLIAQRAGYVHEAARFKKSEVAVRDESRVQVVLQSKRALAKKLGASPDLIERVYSTMITFFVDEELSAWKERQGVTNGR